MHANTGLALYKTRASLLFFFMMALAIALIAVFPVLVTWLPEMAMRK